MILSAETGKCLAPSFVVSEASDVLDHGSLPQSPGWGERWPFSPRDSWPQDSYCLDSSQCQICQKVRVLSVCPVSKRLPLAEDWGPQCCSPGQIWHHSLLPGFRFPFWKFMMTSVTQRLGQPDPAGGERQEVKWLKNWCTAFSMRKQIFFSLITKTVTAFVVHVKNNHRTIYVKKTHLSLYFAEISSRNTLSHSLPGIFLCMYRYILHINNQIVLCWVLRIQKMFPKPSRGIMHINS